MPSPCLLVTWTPTASTLPERLGVTIESDSVITSLNYRHTQIAIVNVWTCPALTTITAPNMTLAFGSEGGYMWGDNSIVIVDNPVLETVSFPLLEEMQGGPAIKDNALLTSINFDSLTTIHAYTNGVNGLRYGFTEIRNNDSMVTLGFPALTTLDDSAGGGGGVDFYVRDNNALVNFSFPNVVVPDGSRIRFNNNALSQASIDHILSVCAASVGFASGSINLTGGTNATPSVAGLADKTILTGRGVVVTNN